MISNRYYILIFVLLATLVGCQDNHLLSSDAEDYVEADMAFAVSTPSFGLTRMAADVVQANSNSPFRGLTDVTIIPFTVDPAVNKVQSSSSPKLFVVTGTESEPSQAHYYYSHCTFMTGTNAVLFYGKAPVLSGATKAENGSLLASFPTRMNPSGISFSPETIVASDEIPAAAQQLADCLTQIANVEGWAATNSPSLKDYYDLFVGLVGNNVSLLSGATANVTAHVNTLKTALGTFERSGLVASILDAIDAHPIPDVDYPANIGLPDGAAVLRWSVTNHRFEVQTERTNLVEINSIHRFAYPAELYYYANSRLLTSYEEIPMTLYQNEKNLAWAALLGTDSLRFTTQSVSGDTKSVAIHDPIQYGVACMKLELSPAASSLLDSHNTAVPIGLLQERHFPLTGVIINGQRTVAFNFEPKNDKDEDDYFVYDHVVNSGSNVGVYLSSTVMSPIPVYTLLLPSYSGQKVTVLLEFQNNSGTDFYGRDGIIYRGTKFYLAGTVDPLDQEHTTANPRGRVFSQDETTTLKVSVTSLANAYHVMPSLLSPRLELGIVLNPEWDTVDPTSLPLY